MARIQLLDDALINKIAAGEVVERPASVVKELMENAIDAGATEIQVELDEGGRKRIAITDNGLGMSEKDAKLCLQRHATSKIRSVEDLFKVGTMGFRGEALAAIAGVSKVTITTREPDAAKGTKVEAVEGRVEVSSWNGPQGTTVTVEDLFYNVPARKSFLKKAASEFATCAELIRHLILSVPHVTVTFFHNGKKQLLAPAAKVENALWKGEAAMRARAAALFPEEEVAALVYARKSSSFGNVEALISPPGMEKPTSKWVHTFVNDRYVKDKTVRYGIMRGYHSHLLRGRHPFVILHLQCDPTLVDVNVHPAKAELRFQYTSEVQDLIAGAIREHLRSGAWAGHDAENPTNIPQEVRTDALDADIPFVPSAAYRSPAAPRDFDLSYGQSSATRSSVGRSVGSSGSFRPRNMEVTRRTESFDFQIPAFSAGATSEGLFDESSSNFSISAANESVEWYALRYLGCFARCYLMFEQNERLLVVDQHAFHERILYEKLTKQKELLTQSQPLLMPEAIEVAPEEAAFLGEHGEGLERIGFKVKVISATEVEVSAVPALMAQKDFALLLQNIAAQGDASLLEEAAEIHHDLLATMACHAAVRAGEELSDEDLQTMLREAQEVDFFLNCPHGRRVFRWYEHRQVAAWFDR